MHAATIGRTAQIREKEKGGRSPLTPRRGHLLVQQLSAATRFVFVNASGETLIAGALILVTGHLASLNVALLVSVAMRNVRSIECV